jgi:hypothetical protein
MVRILKGASWSRFQVSGAYHPLKFAGKNHCQYLAVQLGLHDVSTEYDTVLTAS